MPESATLTNIRGQGKKNPAWHGQRNRERWVVLLEQVVDAVGGSSTARVRCAAKSRFEPHTREAARGWSVSWEPKCHAVSTRETPSTAQPTVSIPTANRLGGVEQGEKKGVVRTAEAIRPDVGHVINLLDIKRKVCRCQEGMGWWGK